MRLVNSTEHVCHRRPFPAGRMLQVSYVQHLSLQGQLTPPRGSTPTATPPRFATPPRSPEPEENSQQSLVKSITDVMFGRLLGGDSDLGSGAPTASTNGPAGAGEGSCVSKLDADSPASVDD